FSGIVLSNIGPSLQMLTILGGLDCADAGERCPPRAPLAHSCAGLSPALGPVLGFGQRHSVGVIKNDEMTWAQIAIIPRNRASEASAAASSTTARIMTFFPGYKNKGRT